MGEYEVTRRNRVRQIREYARYDTEAVHGVLDAGLVSHVGFVQDGQPYVIPMIYGREGEVLYLHGASKARIVKLLGSGAPVCVNVTLLDGIVAARSAFNSSMNYRSAVVFGTGRLIEDEEESLHALEVITEHALSGRWQELRAPLEREIAMTGVIAVAIESASAKISDDPPEDEEDDYATRIWAGVVPITTTLGEPVADGRVPSGVSMSRSIAALEGRRL
ncbi:MAG: pyridoxamine 5'-phosphate oxidase family protein [Deltaproteobacteria bacterium]|nr:pyridoxamine 5'-phosphate oxidase family protein [Deltaproteobacteria bacterium]MBW2398685.1 pyridoxamine 5'-phosphate oxidase family protein [Deltaproteobacteria bacterium]